MIETGYILYIDAVCFTSDTEVNNIKIVKTSYKVPEYWSTVCFETLWV